MREILFRGKTYDGKWEQGDLRHGGYVHNDSETYIMRADYALHNIPVDPKTVGQYTGLTDKNGTKIFEGDIVVVNIKGNFTVCKVAWANNVAQFQLWQTITIPNTPTALNLGNYDCKIVGNVHDNPELLKEN